MVSRLQRSVLMSILTTLVIQGTLHAATPKEIATVEGFLSPMAANCIAFSPDGKLLAAPSAVGRCVKLWDTATGKHKLSLRGMGSLGAPTCLAFSPDGSTVATSGLVWTEFYDATTGNRKKMPRGFGGSFAKCLAYAPDGKTLASVQGGAGSFATISLWDVETGKESKLPEQYGAAAAYLAFSPDGKTLAWGIPMSAVIRSGRILDPEVVVLWDVARGRRRMALTGKKGMLCAQCVAFSPDGKTIAGVGAKTTKVWDIETGKVRMVLGGQGEILNSVAFSPDGAVVATGSTGGTVKLWDAAKGQERATLTAHKKTVHSLAFSLDGGLLATGSDDKTVKLWKLADDDTAARETERDRAVDSTGDREENLLMIETDHGVIKCELLPKDSPKTVARIKELARSGFYNGLTFHRVVPGFVIQGVDP